MRTACILPIPEKELVFRNNHENVWTNLVHPIQRQTFAHIKYILDLFLEILRNVFKRSSLQILVCTPNFEMTSVPGNPVKERVKICSIPLQRVAHSDAEGEREVFVRKVFLGLTLPGELSLG